MLRVALLPILMLAACQSPAPKPYVHDAWQAVQFMSGCWRSDTGDDTSLEVWTAPYGDVMYGQNRQLSSSHMVFFELLTIVRRDQSLVYIAQPGGGEPTEFVMTNHNATSVTFENRQHDFPKRIRYSLTANGELSARVDDGSDEGKNLTFAWQSVR